MFHLLHLWWTETTKWVYDRLDTHAGVVNRDVSLAKSVLHHLAVFRPPNLASSPHLGSRDDVSLEIAEKGTGHAGSVHVPLELWREWADPHFEWAGVHAPIQPPSNCPKTAATGPCLPKKPAQSCSKALKCRETERAGLISTLTVKLNHIYNEGGFFLPFIFNKHMGIRWARSPSLYNAWSINWI